MKRKKYVCEKTPVKLEHNVSDYVRESIEKKRLLHY